jgi:outer membrane biosynthesis protein TonB
MKQGFYVLYNKAGDIARVVPSDFDAHILVYREDLRRVEFVQETQSLLDNEVNFTELGTLEGSKQQKDAVILQGPWGKVEFQNKVSEVQTDIEPKEEDESKDTVFFMKWTSGMVVGLLAVAMVIGFFMKPDEKEEPRVVTVFQQRPQEAKKVVQVSEKKITEKLVKNAKVSNKTQPKLVSDQKTKQTHKTEYSRSGNQLQKMGALSAFGGNSPTSKGLGGLGATRSKSSGYGFDSTRASGGHSRGMLGKGLIQAGIGGGQSIQGYGGTGTRGKGSGEAAFGEAGMAGRSGGYYLPLSEEAKVVGGLDRDQINAVVQRNLGQVIYCYEQGLQSNPDLSGRVTVNFQIAPNGLVSIASVGQTNLNSRKVESCIVGKLRDWKFPRPKGDVSVRVTYPFVLKRLSQG